MKISPFLQQNYLILLKYMEGASIKPFPRVNFTGERSSPLLLLGFSRVVEGLTNCSCISNYADGYDAVCYLQFLIL